MCETATVVSLHENSLSKTFAAEVTNTLGAPLKDVEVVFTQQGEGSLGGDSAVSVAGGRTDETGSAVVSLKRPAGSKGRVATRITAECSVDAAQIRLRLVAVR